MKMRFRAAAATLLLGLMNAVSATAADFDGSKNLLCAAVDVVACMEGVDGPVCRQGNARSFDLAEFMDINFKKKEIRATGNNSDKVSPIMNQEKTETQLIMQGVENDRGWTASLDQADGELALSVTGQDVTFTIFGACTAP